VTRFLLQSIALPACLLLAASSPAFAALQTVPKAASQAAEPADTDAPAEPATVDDAAASRQLQAKLTTDDDLKEVTASVDDGVAELDGSVLQDAHKLEAGKIATETPGVATVVNNVDVNDSLGAHFHAAYKQMTAKLVAIAARGPLLLVAIVIVLVAVWGGGVLSRNLRMLRMRTVNPYMDGLIRRTVRIVVTIVGVLLALNLLGLSSRVGAVLGNAHLLLRAECRFVGRRDSGRSDATTHSACIRRDVVRLRDRCGEWCALRRRCRRVLRASTECEQNQARV